MLGPYDQSSLQMTSPRANNYLHNNDPRYQKANTNQLTSESVTKQLQMLKGPVKSRQQPDKLASNSFITN